MMHHPFLFVIFRILKIEKNFNSFRFMFVTAYSKFALKARLGKRFGKSV